MISRSEKILISCSNGKKISELDNILKKNNFLQIFYTDKNKNIFNRKGFIRNLGPDNKEYLDNLISKIKKNKINKYIPLADEEVFIASKNINYFKKNKIKVFCNDFNIVKILNNKIKTLKFLAKLKINVPIWKKFNNQKEFIESIEFYLDNRIDLVVKPIISRGNREIYYFKKKNYINLKNSFKKFKNNFFFNEMLFPDYYDVDLFSKRITNDGVIIRKNLNPLNPTKYKGFKIIKNQKFSEQCQKINKKINNKFIIDIDAMTDKNGIIKIIEMNSRPSGAFSYSIKKNILLQNEFIKYLSK